jgi:multidrug efflux pump subunit AcrA (membrane-fusion protein)
LNANRAIAEVAKDSLIAVNVVPAARGKAGTELTLPSTLQPVMEAPIYARTNGYVKRWLVDIGAKVKAGQLLAEIETPEVDRELKQAIANKGQVKANLDLARTTADRWQLLLKDKAVSQQEVDEKIGALAARQADLAAADASVQRLQELQGFQHVLAPFDGTITARNVDVGQPHYRRQQQSQQLAVQVVQDWHPAAVRVRAADAYPPDPGGNARGRDPPRVPGQGFPRQGIAYSRRIGRAVQDAFDRSAGPQ